MKPVLHLIPDTAPLKNKERILNHTHLPGS